MTVLVRDIRPGVRADAEGFCATRRLALPYLMATADSVVHDLIRQRPEARHRLLVAEVDGEIVGTAQTGLSADSPEPGQAYLNVYVRPDRTGEGAGSLLVRTAEEHLATAGATKVFAWVLDRPEDRAFAARRGYTPSRAAHFLRLDLTTAALPGLPPLPPGVELRTGADFADDPRPLFTLDAETTLDEPSDIEAALTDYPAWLAETWHHPLLNHELTSVVLVDGVPAAFSAAYTDELGRYGSAMTGTARAHRGRGLAKLAKTDSLLRARAAGRTEAITGNDADNGPMLAINKAFGYEIRVTEVSHARALGG
ncbi:GNAT family N-acetyltransferase [Streptomyces sp. NPDC048290]|uniref:GNAT family N-acetyltransferase n=1 Tax=Streptomyces sp. NPDC048290 TaxID=3155811 RepID=UPI003439BA9D